MAPANNLPQATLYVARPESTKTWVHHFLPQVAGDRLLHLPYSDALSDVPEALKSVQTALHAVSTRVFFLSSHESIENDASICAALRAKGYEVSGPTEALARIAHDKIWVKELFDEHRIPTPKWRLARGRSQSDVSNEFGRASVLAKGADGTMGQGNRIFNYSDEIMDGGVYLEEFVHGTEYSVIVRGRPSRWTTLPIVWKGSTNTDLVPPFRRLRICPSPMLAEAVEAEMRKVAVRLAAMVDLDGIMEVEFVVLADGHFMVLEINPRIAATMKMAALSAVPTSLFVFHGPKVQSAARVSLEVPLISAPKTLPEDAYATTRLTLVADTFAELSLSLDRFIAESTVLDCYATELATLARYFQNGSSVRAPPINLSPGSSYA